MNVQKSKSIHFTNTAEEEAFLLSCYAPFPIKAQLTGQLFPHLQVWHYAFKVELFFSFAEL